MGIGKEGYRSHYSDFMLLDNDGWIRIYTNSSFGEHNDRKKLKGNDSYNNLNISFALGCKRIGKNKLIFAACELAMWLKC